MREPYVPTKLPLVATCDDSGFVWLLAQQNKEIPKTRMLVPFFCPPPFLASSRYSITIDSFYASTTFPLCYYLAHDSSGSGFPLLFFGLFCLSLFRAMTNLEKINHYHMHDDDSNTNQNGLLPPARTRGPSLAASFTGAN